MTKNNGTCPVCGDYEQLRLDYKELAEATALYLSVLNLMLSTGNTDTGFLDTCTDQVTNALCKYKKREEDEDSSNDKQTD